jgi:hypothetical protein
MINVINCVITVCFSVTLQIATPLEAWKHNKGQNNMF